ncbi:hypothetical protein ACFO8Q_15525 [Effusibacillus consociatus]|uniref:Uncharacterized protein n=1 Tax=Effusibacillus consociatus TaxID=1117041 RepID=A0ABV9Q7Y2_9BACL
MDLQHQAFNCGGTDRGWFLHLFENLREISRLSRNEFVVQQRQHYDVHPHDWKKTAYIYDLPEGMLEQLGEDKCIQFRLSSSGGRVHGFMIENRFYVVWLDPHHNLYPDQRFGGLKFFDKPLNPYEELLLQYKELEKKYNELSEILDAYTTPDSSAS